MFIIQKLTIFDSITPVYVYMYTYVVPTRDDTAVDHCLRESVSVQKIIVRYVLLRLVASLAAVDRLDALQAKKRTGNTEKGHANVRILTRSISV